MSELDSQLDVRWPIGLLFAVLGLLVAAYGLMASPEPVPAQAGGQNLDFGWGLVMLLFGLLMIWGGWNAGKRGS